MTEPRKTPIHEVYFAAGTDPNYGGQQLHNVVLLDDHLRETQELAEAMRSALGWLEKGGVRSAHSALATALARHRAKQEGGK